ncbi:hypothetical protein C8R45DRAFT_1081705 [Mycena sanguinolenta]|nr:hypothetical protein C8R45DRAFT_1081705 [Mycena sanguinolenta]
MSVRPHRLQKKHGRGMSGGVELHGMVRLGTPGPRKYLSVQALSELTVAISRLAAVELKGTKEAISRKREPRNKSVTQEQLKSLQFEIQLSEPTRLIQPRYGLMCSTNPDRFGSSVIVSTGNLQWKGSIVMAPISLRPNNFTHCLEFVGTVTRGQDVVGGQQAIKVEEELSPLSGIAFQNAASGVSVKSRRRLPETRHHNTLFKSDTRWKNRHTATKRTGCNRGIQPGIHACWKRKDLEAGVPKGRELMLLSEEPACIGPGRLPVSKGIALQRKPNSRKYDLASEEKEQIHTYRRRCRWVHAQ